ncbi:32 kDa beta-galactoside-binding lectin-like [Chironomus tepperi]|uniref:32 kDa beta-galactoside-binding lectin-like n=1 Tax=Chironomus tepperi TaxID=113505 RepID=UPI00391F231B
MAVCLSSLYTNVEIGHILIVSFKLKENSLWSKIDFSNDIDEINNIPLSINIDEKNCHIKFASFVNGYKKIEECFKMKQIYKNNKIKFYILTLDDKFRIALNDEHLCNINYKCDLSYIKLIRITGDVDYVTQIDHRKIYPQPWPQNQEDLSTVSFSSDLPCKFSENTIVVLRMTLSGATTGSFFIRFNEMGSKKQLLHLNPRLDEKVIVVNSMNDKLEWQTELRCLRFPFVLKSSFQLAIFMDSSFFQVAMNGEHLLKYPFKTGRSTTLSSSNCKSIYDKLTGFKIFAQNGLKIHVSYVDIFKLKENDSKFYEIYSNSNFM